MSIVEVNHLTKKYGTTEVLKDINLEIYQGEVLVLWVIMALGNLLSFIRLQV